MGLRAFFVGLDEGGCDLRDDRVAVGAQASHAGGYPAYKDSGVPWLGQVPEAWEVKAVKYVSTFNDEALPETTDPELMLSYVDISSVSLVEGIKKIEPVEFEKAPSRARRVVREGDTIVSTVRTYLKAIAPIRNPVDNMIVSTGFAVIRPDQTMNPDFLGYFIQSEGFVGEVVSKSTGVSYPAINPGDLVAISGVRPPIEEQSAIADFLDKKTAEIDDLIAKKEELLRLLAEQRTALITHAVTKGLNPNAPMKPSGIDWLGDVPEGWEVKPLKFLGRFQNGISIGGDSFGSGFPFVSYGDVYKNLSLPGTGSGLVESTAKDRVLYSVERGDIFFTRTSETIEEIAISSVCETTIPDAVFAGFLIRCRPYPKRLDVGFSKYYFRNSRLRDYFVKEMNLVTRASLGQTLLGNLTVALPPLDEQNRIAVFLDEKLGNLARVEADARKAIGLLKEYRTSIITSAVTGKIKVA